ncbi:MAG: M20 family metallopeptidase [Promethearchaeota archaeon]
MTEDLIIKSIDNNKNDYIQFVKELIQIDSFNPPGNEKNIAIKIKSFLEDSNIKCEIFPFENNRANLIAFLNEKFEGKNLLYNAHMDVVPPGKESEWNNPPLSAYSTEKKIFGRGAADMKGGLAAMTIALKILKQFEIETPNNLILNAVADEETGGKLGTKWCVDNVLKKKNIKLDYSIVGEPSGMATLPKTIILGEKGRLVLKVVTNGISGHASAPFLGKNAITMMSEIIQKLDEIEKLMHDIKDIKPSMSHEELENNISSTFPDIESYQEFLKKNPYLKPIIQAISKFTQSLNMIEGGIKDNVIPDQCSATIDFRLLPNQTPEITINAFKKIINELGYEVRDSPIGDPKDVFVYIEVIKVSEASFWKDWDKSINLQNFSSIIENVYKEKPIYLLFPASSDAHYLRNSNYCPQTILFGPGNGMLAHATNEYISIDDFINSIKVFTLFACRFLKDEG